MEKPSRKKPERMCLACRARKEKNEFFRIVRTESGVILDETGRSTGRGAYLCKNETCIEDAFQKSKIRFHLKTEVDSSLKQTLLTALEELRLKKEKEERKTKIVRIRADGSKEDL